MYIPINAKAEGRILVPWEHAQYPNITEQATKVDVEKMRGGECIPDWRGDGNVWEAFRRTCPPDCQARRLFSSLRGDIKQGQQPLNFLKDFDVPGVKQETDF